LISLSLKGWFNFRDSAQRFPGEGEEGQVAGSFDLAGQLALMLGAGAGLSSGSDLSMIADKTTQGFDVLIVDFHFRVCAESALPFPEAVIGIISVSHLILLVIQDNLVSSD
jgi:hypothetical protein